MKSLREHLRDAERDYWRQLAAECATKEKAAPIAGMSLATLYRRAAPFFARALPNEPPSSLFPQLPRGKVRRMPNSPLRMETARWDTPMPIALSAWRRRRYYGVHSLFGYFGVFMPKDEWTATRKRKSVREYERLYEITHRHYRIWMRRCHPDVVKSARVDPAEVNALWAKLRGVIRKEMEALGASL